LAGLQRYLFSLVETW